MAQNRSQVYDVDNRYSQTEEARDNTAGKRFLKNFMERDRQSRYPGIEAERREDNRITNYGTGGTVPMAALGLGQKVGNTNSRSTYKNPFRASQSEPKNYTTIEESEEQDKIKSLGEMVSQNVRSAYRKDVDYIKDPIAAYYS